MGATKRNTSSNAPTASVERTSANGSPQAGSVGTRTDQAAEDNANDQGAPVFSRPTPRNPGGQINYELRRQGRKTMLCACEKARSPPSGHTLLCSNGLIVNSSLADFQQTSFTKRAAVAIPSGRRFDCAPDTGSLPGRRPLATSRRNVRCGLPK